MVKEIEPLQVMTWPVVAIEGEMDQKKNDRDWNRTIMQNRRAKPGYLAYTFMSD